MEHAFWVNKLITAVAQLLEIASNSAVYISHIGPEVVCKLL